MGDEVTTDPLATVADAMQNAVQAARDGAADAKERAEQAVPQIGLFLSRFAYTTSYAVSYGVVFPTMLLARSIPRENPVFHGLQDGGAAAVAMLDEMKRKREQQRAEASVEPQPAS